MRVVLSGLRSRAALFATLPGEIQLITACVCSACLLKTKFIQAHAALFGRDMLSRRWRSRCPSMRIGHADCAPDGCLFHRTCSIAPLRGFHAPREIPEVTRMRQFNGCDRIVSHPLGLFLLSLEKRLVDGFVASVGPAVATEFCRNGWGSECDKSISQGFLGHTRKLPRRLRQNSVATIELSHP